MGRVRKKYPREFKLEAVKLMRRGELKQPDATLREPRPK